MHVLWYINNVILSWVHNQLSYHDSLWDIDLSKYRHIDDATKALLLTNLWCLITEFVNNLADAKTWGHTLRIQHMPTVMGSGQQIISLFSFSRCRSTGGLVLKALACTLILFLCFVVTTKINSEVGALAHLSGLQFWLVLCVKLALQAQF